MMNGKYSLRDVAGSMIVNNFIATFIIQVLLIVLLILIIRDDRKNHSLFKQEAIEHGFASYKVDNKGVVIFEWSK